VISLYFFAQILQETEVGVLDVLLFADGHWKAAEAHKENSDKYTVDATQQTRDTVQTDSSSSYVVDLIRGKYDDLPMNLSSASEDTKPVLNSQDLSMLDYLPDFLINSPVRPGLTSSNMVLTSQTLSPSSSNGLVSSSFGNLEPLWRHSIVTDAVSPLVTSNSTSGVSRPIPRNPGCEAVGVQDRPVLSSRRLQPNCSPPVPRPSSSTNRAHQAMISSSVIIPVNNDGGSLPRAPTAAPLLHQQSTTLVGLLYLPVLTSAC
jgi:E3 SUMO-protein ligase PIAS1